MPLDVILQIDPGVKGIDVRYFGPGTPDAGKVFERAAPQIAAADLDRLRRGDAPEVVVREVQAQISQWLLAADLDPLISNLLGDQTRPPIRLVLRPDLRLRAAVDDLPFEMLASAGAQAALALHKQVESIVNVLPGTVSGDATTSRSWPLRILVVRSNPASAGGAVPAAVPIAQKIRALRPDLGPDQLVIDVLSREQAPEVVGLPTRSGLRKRLESSAYDILVFIGHGDVIRSHQDVAPIGAIQLEMDDGQQADPFTSERLAALLHRSTVPVVLLLGCLTAADATPDLIDRMPEWMRGNVGVAQALVNSNSGVRVAVGMRYRTDSKDAVTFAETFFGRLLGGVDSTERAGDVEASVHRARGALHTDSDFPASWAAPVVFAARHDEPLFPFLRDPPAPLLGFDPLETSLQIIWRQLARLSRRLWNDGDIPFKADVDGVRADLVQRGTANRMMLLPEWHVADPGARVTVPIVLHGNRQLTRLHGVVKLDGPGSTLVALQAGPDAAVPGLRVETGTQGNARTFTLEAAPGATVPRGRILEAIVDVGAATQAVHALALFGIRATASPMAWSSSVIVVPAP
jgi:hypothetical protein